jgi:hypothetical protein
MSAEKTRVVILGAGPAGLAAASVLAENPAYEVHVYQVGWRAGGKCATGREPGSLRAKQNGSHYLFGCYHNAFRLIRKAHGVLAARGERDFGTFHGDFVARNLLVGAQRYTSARNGKLKGDWFRYLPQNLETPGDPRKFPSPFDCILMAAQFLLGTVIDLLTCLIFFRTDSERFSGVRWLLRVFPLSPFEPGRWPRFVRGVLLPLRFVFNELLWAPAAKLLGVLGVFVVFVVPGGWLEWLRSRWRQIWPKFISVARDGARLGTKLGQKLHVACARRIERLFIVADLGLTVLRGYYKDDLDLPGGYARIDRYDFRAWLKRHGADDTTANSALVETWYDAVIAYPQGVKRLSPDGSELEHDGGSCAAGVVVHAMLCALLGFKGAFAYQMRAEVGDSFVAPIVRALELSGVTFHFYHRVQKIVVDDAARAVTRLEFSRQTEGDGVGADFVLVPDQGKPGKPLRKAWPDAPQRQVPAGPGDLPIDSYYSRVEVEPVTLVRRGTPGERAAGEFDLVISALPIGIVEDVLVDAAGHRLADVPGPFRECFTNVESTESQAIRVWFSVPLGAKKAKGRSLGWEHDPPILSGYQGSHSTWEDNSQAVDVQALPEDQQPKTIATVFGPLPTRLDDQRVLDVRAPDHYTTQLARARQAADAFIAKYMLDLWPGLTLAAGATDRTTTEVDWTSFIDTTGGVGQARFAWQHVSANVGPMESYVMTFPGKHRYRLAPDESGYRNLFLAGDWTRNGVEVGTVEGAVVSGLKAARAITGADVPIVGGEDFERGTLFQEIPPPKRKEWMRELLLPKHPERASARVA